MKPPDPLMTPRDVALQGKILRLGRILSERSGSIRRHAPQQSSTEELEAMTRQLMSDVRASQARKTFGLKSGYETPHDALRISTVSLVAWRMLTEQSPGTSVEAVSLAITDLTKEDSAEALLIARDALARMTVERLLVLSAEGSGKWGGRLLLSPKVYSWMAGGQNSRGDFSPAKLGADRMRKSGGEADRDGSDAVAQTTPIPTAASLHEKIARSVIGLDGQVRALSSLLVMHLARAKMLRAGKDPGTGNTAILLIGNSGCGKSHLMSEAGRIVSCPYASQSATAWTSEGFIGGKVDSLFQALVTKAGGDLQAARFGIFHADEWDKKAFRYGSRGDITTLSIQQEVLVPMQGAEFPISGKRSMEPVVTFDSRGTFFVFSGAFDGLAELITKKTGKANIGFIPQSGVKTKEQEFIFDAVRSYGYVREWTNRLSAAIFLSDPSIKSLKIGAAGTILNSFNALLGELGITLVPNAGAVSRMAEFALESRLFYRGIKCVWWNLAESAVSAGTTGMQKITVADVDSAISRVSSGAVGLPTMDGAAVASDDGFGGAMDSAVV